MLEIYKFVAEKYKRGMQYIGVKTEFVTPRGIRVYFRLRAHDERDGQHIIVDLIAEHEEGRLVYQCFGHTTKAHVLLEEAARAIGTYVVFSDYIIKHADQRAD